MVCVSLSANALREDTNLPFPKLWIKIVGETELFSFGKAISQVEGKTLNSKFLR